MKEYILVSHQVPEDVCDKLVEESGGWEKHRWYNNETGTASNIFGDTTELDVVNTTKEAQDLLASY